MKWSLTKFVTFQWVITFDCGEQRTKYSEEQCIKVTSNILNHFAKKNLEIVNSTMLRKNAMRIITRQVLKLQASVESPEKPSYRTRFINATPRPRKIKNSLSIILTFRLETSNSQRKVPSRFAHYIMLGCQLQSK